MNMIHRICYRLVFCVAVAATVVLAIWGADISDRTQAIEPNPMFHVRALDDQVHGNEWPEGALVTLTIDDPGTGPGVDYSDAQTAGPGSWDLFFGFQGVFDVQPGHIVTLSDGVTVKTHTVTNLTVTAVDPDIDTVAGTADPGTDVYVDACDESGCSSRNVAADGTTGDWFADFSVAGGEPGQEIFDLVPGSQGNANQWDDDGDATLVDWRVPNPSFSVWAEGDWVDGNEWPEGALVTLTIDDPGTGPGADYTDSQIVGPHPMGPQQTFVNFDFPGAFDVQPGHIVALTDGVTVKTHTVTNLTLTAVDADTDTVSGTADPGTDVNVDTGDEFASANRHEVADGSGDWTADFSTPGDEDFEQDTFDIGPGSGVNAHQWDDDGDGTNVGWRVPNPHFWVSPEGDRVDGNEWPEGALVTLTIDDPGTGPGVDYTGTQTVTSDEWDNTYVNFGLQGLFDVQPGHIVTLSDGVTVKTHTVTNLAVTAVDPDTDTVSGTADPGTDVNVDTCDESGCVFLRHEVADGSGDWTADFSTPGDEDFEQDTFDIGPGSGGNAHQQDDDGDITQVDWRVPNPNFWVSPFDDQVNGNEWPEGALVTLTIDDPGTGPGADYSDTQTVTSDEWGNTHVNFGLQGLFDVQPGHLVTLSDGVTVKTHTVTNLTVTAVDPDTDTVSGTADPGADVNVDTWDEFGSAWRHEVADGSGDWTADFSTPGDEDFEQDTFDVGPGSGGNAHQQDDDGDATIVDWRVPNLRFWVSPFDERVNGNEWPLGAAVTLTIDDPDTGPGADYTDSQIADSNGWVSFGFWGTFDVQPGHLVTLTDGTTVKTHTVTNLAVTAVDPDTDTVSGTADPGTDVEIHTCDESGCVFRYEVADGSGDWSADFSVPGDEPGEEGTYDIVPGSEGETNQWDDDGDGTHVHWRVPNPHIVVSPVNDYVDANDWPEGADVTLTIDDPSNGPGVDYSDTKTVGPAPWDPSQTWVGFSVGGMFDIQPGHLVTMSDGVTTKEHTVTNLTVTDVDPDTDTVSGTADPGADVEVLICDESGCAWLNELADGAGNWAADFSATYDIVSGTNGDAREIDDDRDGTQVYWGLPNPSFSVWLGVNEVQGNEWPLGMEVMLTIDDPDTGPGVDYTDTQTVVADPWGGPGQTWVSFEFQGLFDVQPGHIVTLSDGVTVKTHTVTNLTVAAVDPDTDTVAGTADPGTDIWIGIWEEGAPQRHEVADGAGDWTADFSAPGDEPGEGDTYDIRPGMGGTASQTDDDGDSTQVGWYVPNPSFTVWAEGDFLDGYEWPEGAEVTLTIDDPDTGPGADYSDTQTMVADPGNPVWTSVSFEFQGLFDVQPGHLVTLTDGVTSKEHTVTNLALTAVDPDLDTVSGTADPATDVNVDICDESGCASRHEVTNGAGDWSADFSTPGDEPGEEGTYDIVPGSAGPAYQQDDDGDSTNVGWWVPQPTPMIVSVGSGSAAPGGQVTLPVEIWIPSGSVGAITVETLYDPAFLDAVACDLDPDSLFDGGVCNEFFDSDDTDPDKVKFNLTSTLGVSGHVLLAEITFDVSCQPGESTQVTPGVTVISDTGGNPLPVTEEAGIVTCGLKGDVSCDGSANVIDALFIMQYEVALRDSSNDCPPLLGTLFLPGCDVNNDTSCNVIDALFIMQCEVGFPNVFCPSAPATASIGNEDLNDRTSPQSVVTAHWSPSVSLNPSTSRQ